MIPFYFQRIPRFIQWLWPSILWRGKGASDELYLTFDDGPNPKTTPVILSILADFEVKATFFLSGSETEKYPELVKQVVARGHVIANHGYKHVSARTQKTEEWWDEIQQTEKLLSTYDSHLVCQYRPPYGLLTWRQWRFAQKSGYTLSLWTMMPGDFDSKKSNQDCLDTLVRKTQAGDIIVLHDNEKAVSRLSEILPKYLQYAKSEGFQFKLLE